MTANVAFEILYKEYYVRVFGLSRRLLNSAPLAEDATQETFMRAYRNFDKYNSSQPFWQWIASIANNNCVDVLRRRSRVTKLFGEEQEETELLESKHTHITTLIADIEDSDSLIAAIDQLPDKYRVPIVLAYFNDCTYEQIAEDLSISRNHVGVLLLRAKQQLRTNLADEGMTEFQP
jgi:RNA polymerase sigma-70 factor (ECF subfamily)